MPRKRNIIDRTPRSRVFEPATRDLASFGALKRALTRWPQLFRVWTARDQSAGAHAGKLTERERVSVAACALLVQKFGEAEMLNASLDERFLGSRATALEDADPKLPDPDGGDDWLGIGNYRIRDLIKRHRERLQPPR